MKSSTIIKALQQDGWQHVKTRGSHTQWKHPTKKGKVTVPHPKKDLHRGTVKSIEIQSGVRFQ